jgi:hypothetical protein
MTRTHNVMLANRSAATPHSLRNLISSLYVFDFSYSVF